MKKLFLISLIFIGVGALLFQQPSHGQQLGAFAPVSVPAGGTGFSSTSINSFIVSGPTATSSLRATSSPTVGYITATSTTATSTFANGINLLGGCLRVGGSCLTSGDSSFSTTSISASAPLVWDTALARLTTNFSTSTYNLFTGTNGFQRVLASSTILTDGQLLVGTSTSAATLGVQGNFLLSGDITSSNITASGTATTTNIRISDTLTIGGDNITEFVGTGLTLSGSTLTTSLGTSVDLGSSEVTGTLLVANGGTGSTTLGGILLGNGTSAVSATGTVAVAWGGTGANSFTLNSIIVGNSNGALIASTSLGNDVISDGLTLTNLTQITNRAISDTTGTLLVGRGGTGATTLGDTELLVGAGTNAVTSTTTLAVYRGGTGFGSYSVGDLLYAGASNALTKLAISGTAGQVLMVSGGVPVWAATSTAASSTLLADFNNWTNIDSYRTATALVLPRTASSTGSIALADGQLAIVTGNGQTGYITATSSLSWNISSSTLDASGKKFSVGTSTFLLRNDPEPLTMLGFYCVASTTGTAHVAFSDGVNDTETSVCTTGTYTKTVTNNTWTAYEALVIKASSTAGAVSRITVTAVLNKTQN